MQKSSHIIFTGTIILMQYFQLAKDFSQFLINHEQDVV